MRSDKPFPAVLAALMAEQEVGLRELTRRCRFRADWGSHHGIGLLLRSEMRPTMHAMETIAGALGVAPETFAEYRLGQVRLRLDPDVVGLAAALKELARLTGPAADAEPEPHVPGAEARGGREGRAASS